MSEQEAATAVAEAPKVSGKVEKVGKAVAEKAHGKPLSYYKGLNLPDKLEYAFKYTQYTEDAAGIAAMVADKNEMTLMEQLRSRNVDALNNARSNERNAEFERRGIVKPTAENDLSIAFKDMLKTLTAIKLPDGSRKYTDEQARAQAAMLSGYDPDAPADSNDNE